MKKLKSIVAVYLSITVLLLLCSCAEPAVDGGSAQTAVAKVNGETVTQQERDYFSGRLRADVINEFISLYGAEYDDGFWSASYGGTTPEAELEKRALDECVRAKIQLVLCREQGIYDDISYYGLYNKAVGFNSRNSSGTVGVTSISLESFYTYYIDTGVMQLKNLLAERLAPSASEVESRAGEYSDELDAQAVENAVIDELTDKNFEEYIDSLCENAELVMM